MNEIITPEANLSHSSLSREALQDLGRGILTSIEQSTRIYSESPPEARLGTLLRISSHARSEPSLEVLARERVTFPTDPVSTAEVDLVLRHLTTEAIAVIEVEGWKWHRRTLEEHDREIERDRRLRCCFPHLVRYSATEVLRNPWKVLLDIYRHLGAWHGFEDVQMNPLLRAVAEACGIESGPDHPVLTSAEERLSTLSSTEALRQIGTALPLPPPTSDPALRRIREVYPRMYANWEPEEAAALRDAFLARIDIEDAALALGRTESALWAQLKRMQLVAG